MQMMAAYCSEISVSADKATRRHKPEDYILNHLHIWPKELQIILGNQITKVTYQGGQKVVALLDFV
jgi:hypothetical protein